MGSTSVPALLVTANVGSIFEDPSEMLKIWTEEFLSTVAKLDPKFIALHCQEVGGKNYENSMKHVEHFVKLLMSSNELRLFDKIRVFLDEDYSSAENFTALGNLYFIHESIENVLIWDFNDVKFVPVQGKEIYPGNIEGVVTKEKAKFPQDFFPECKWSRKGFMRTRWSVNGTVLDLINIHLFHDASNFIAMEKYPSVYCKNRRRALEHTLQRFHNDRYGTAPYFVFGDFNFRTDTESVINKLTEGLTTTRLQNNKNSEHTKLQYANDESELVLTVGKKEFNHLDHQKVFLTPSPTWLKTFDKELEAFDEYLTEYPITFPPSYPFEENISHARSYMQTRCPAWCDRVLLSHTAKQLVNDEETVEYGLMGLDTCMGDHKKNTLTLTLLALACLKFSKSMEVWKDKNYNFLDFEDLNNNYIDEKCLDDRVCKNNFDEFITKRKSDSRDNELIGRMLDNGDQKSARVASYYHSLRPMPCSCGIEFRILDLGHQYYPRYLHTGVCKSDLCGGLYRCIEKHYKIRVLKQKDPRNPEMKTSLSFPENLKSVWQPELVTVTVACECSL